MRYPWLVVYKDTKHIETSTSNYLLCDVVLCVFVVLFVACRIDGLLIVDHC